VDSRACELEAPCCPALHILGPWGWGVSQKEMDPANAEDSAPAGGAVAVAAARLSLDSTQGTAR
jgi:hypothetical protein